MAFATLLPADPKARTAVLAFGGALAMLGLGFASVPLYRIFCQVTGFGGTTMRASVAEAATIKTATRTISVRFDANIDRDLPWRFAPEQVTQEMRIGERKQAFYRSENLSGKAVKGVASFNVSPAQMGKYFKKIDCFCFQEQTLQAGQKVDMPVIYYVDPAILDDPDTKDIEQITLSYTFHMAADQN